MIRARESKSAPVGVVVKVLKILEAIHDAPAGLQLKQVAKQTAINKSTAYRFLAHLEGEGYLYRDDAGAYVIGPKLARLGSGINYEESLRKISRPILHKLWMSTGETVNLSVLDGQDVLYLDVIESSHTFRLASQVGSRRPLYCTSLGKAMMAFLSSEQVDELIGSFAFVRNTPHTLIHRTKLKKDLERTHQRGYALDDEEAVLGARCVAAPVFDAGANVAAVVSVSGPITRISAGKVPLMGTLVRQAAAEISARLGYAES
ncbi:MAG TPA: IclR family transcriptional regulator [Terriglobales bacterium]